MKKRVFKRLVIIFLIIMLIFILTSNYKAFALTDVTSDSWADRIPQGNATPEFDSKVKDITGIIRTCGIVISVISLSIIGIKYMVTSVEEKANYKQAMVPWLTGAVLVFAITFIPTILFELSDYSQKALEEKKEIKTQGYDDAYYNVHIGLLTARAGMAETTDFAKRLEYYNSWLGSTVQYYQGNDKSNTYKEGYNAIIKEVLYYLDMDNTQLGNYIKVEDIDGDGKIQGNDYLELKTLLILQYVGGGREAKSDIDKGKITDENLTKKMNDALNTVYQDGSFNMKKYGYYRRLLVEEQAGL